MRTSRPRRTPGRPAGDAQRVVRAVLDATVRQLAKKGFAELSVEEVARDAGVNKTSVYRRWPSKAELVVAALQSVRAEEPPFEESGDLRRDLIGILRRKVAVLTNPRGRKLARALLFLDHSAETVAFVRSVRERQNAPLVALLQRAVERGEIERDASAQLLAEFVLAPITQRALGVGLAVDEGYIETVVDHLLRAAHFHKKRL